MRRALARKRVMLSCFFDIAQAFDTVWHGKLLYQLKQAGISPSLYRFVNSFLTGRTMAVRWKNTISPKRTIDTGVPQGSIIAPMLFTLMLQDVGKGLQKDTILTAYADDLAIWRTTTFRRPNKNGLRQKSALKIFLNEVNTIVRSLRDSGFMLSAQKTVFMPVTPKEVSSPDNLQIDVQGTPVKGSHSVRYLGVTFQCNGHSTKQVDRAIANARKALNLLRAVRRESWGQERKTLVHLTLSLVRSRLLFGSQALFSLPPSHMQRLAAVECTALRLALGLPRGVPQRRVYNEAGVLPLWHCIRRDACKYLFNSACVPNSIEEELELTFTPTPITNQHHGIVTASQELYQEAGVCVQDRHRTVKQHGVLKPPWKREPPEVRNHLPGLSKDDSPHLLASQARELLAGIYKHDYHIYTDGSVLEDGSTGAGVYLDAVKTSISLKLSPSPILAALQVLDMTKSPPKTVTILSDSRSSLDILSREYCKSQPELLSVIQGLTSSLQKKGVSVRYHWVLSHVGLSENEQADLAAKAGAQRVGRPDLTLRPSISDLVRRVNRAAWSRWAKDYREAALHHNWPMTECQGDSTETLFPRHPPQVGHLMTRIRLNCSKSKYTLARCPCLQENVSFQHCLFDCPTLQTHSHPLRDLFQEKTDKLRLLQLTSKDGPDGWRPLTLAATLAYSSAVGPYL